MHRLWIDLDNSPHVPLFAPLILKLQSLGWNVKVTARNFAQTLDLVEQLSVEAVAVGKHAGKNKINKVLNLPVRAIQLINEVKSFSPTLSLSHGSRTQAIASKLMGIPIVTMFDYEWSEMKILGTLSKYMLCPDYISMQRLKEAGLPINKVIYYKGLKEDLYIHNFLPNPGFRLSIGCSESMKLIVIRPPGIIGNYHNVLSELLCKEIVLKAISNENNFVVILPKTELEKKFISKILDSKYKAKVLVPLKALDGLQLIYHSDICFSGGGTMNREAVALGKHAYSLFTGKRGAVDEELNKLGKLTFLNSNKDIENIDWNLNSKPEKYLGNNITDEIIKVLKKI
ncbi:MAG: DUF354 domain-containing protein [Chlorobiota bacterium]|nr:DUF354 domain-containing protein [Chlorobiota bacterium]QQS65549.1 MAG: DUF354 domain-containing protein [Chlorobiota bacterium]